MRERESERVGVRVGRVRKGESKRKREREGIRGWEKD